MIPAEELQRRLKDYWMLIANIAGLTSGFSYVVASSEINFADAQVGFARRADIFGFLITTSFLFSLGSTLLAALLFASVNILGPEGTVRFVQQFYWLCGKPLTLCLLGVFFMLASQVPTVAALYSQWVYIYVLVFGLLLIFIAMGIYIKVQKAMIHMMDEKIIASQRNLQIDQGDDTKDTFIDTNNQDEETGIKYE